MNSSGIEILAILTAIIIIDLIVKIKTRTYAIILFTCQTVALLGLITFLIIGTFTKTNLYPILFITIIGFSGLLKQFLSLKNKKLFER